MIEFIYDKFIRQRIEAEINRQAEILQLMTIFPAYYQYKSNPTYQQMEQLVDICNQQGYSTTNLYHIFATGNIPQWLDDIIKDLSRYWQPSGDIVDADDDIRLISEKAIGSDDEQ
jgi:hypothetical protein